MGNSATGQEALDACCEHILCATIKVDISMVVCEGIAWSFCHEFENACCPV